MQYRKETERHFARLVLTGRFTGQDTETARHLIAEIKDGAARRYLLDVSGLEFIDSAGIGMLLVFNGEAASQGKHVAMLAAGGQVRKVLDLTRIAMIIPIFEAVEDYVAASVPEALLATVHPCAPGEDPMAIAARALVAGPSATPRN